MNLALFLTIMAVLIIIILWDYKRKSPSDTETSSKEEQFVAISKAIAQANAKKAQEEGKIECPACGNKYDYKENETCPACGAAAGDTMLNKLKENQADDVAKHLDLNPNASAPAFVKQNDKILCPFCNSYVDKTAEAVCSSCGASLAEVIAEEKKKQAMLNFNLQALELSMQQERESNQRKTKAMRAAKVLMMPVAGLSDIISHKKNKF